MTELNLRALISALDDEDSMLNDILNTASNIEDIDNHNSSKNLINILKFSEIVLSKGLEEISNNAEVEPYKLIDGDEYKTNTSALKKLTKGWAYFAFICSMLTVSDDAVLTELLTNKTIAASFFTLFIHSSFKSAADILVSEVEKELNLSTDTKIPQDQVAIYFQLSVALLRLNALFFSTHEWISITKPDIPIDAEAELKQLAQNYVKFHKQKKLSFTDSIAEFIKSPSVREQITEISRAPSFGLPMSKVWRLQNFIAQNGLVNINVGNKAKNERVIVEASIVSKDGNTLVLSELKKAVERAIGNLIDEHHGKLPIIVTRQQIYRALARLDSNATVTEQQAQEIENVVDELMYTPARINFKTQIAQHKNMRHQSDYDYESSESGIIQGSLIQATKSIFYDRNGDPYIAYKIYEYPAYYLYSHIIGQIANVPNALLTGAKKAAIKESSQPGAQGNARYAAMKGNILTRILRMKTEIASKKKKWFSNIIKTQEVADDLEITLSAQTEKTLRKNIKLYLEDLKAQDEVTDFQEAKQGRKIIGFSITLSKQNKGK